MTAPLPTRRSFITGLISLVAAPAIVRAGSLMPVRAMIGSSPSEINAAVRRMMIDMAEREVNPPWIAATPYPVGPLVKYGDGYLMAVPSWVTEQLR